MTKEEGRAEAKKYLGVSYRHNVKKKYTATVGYLGKTIRCGEYHTALEAVKARDMYILKHNLPIATQVIVKPK